MSTHSDPGRPRDPDLTRSILEAAIEILSNDGLASLTYVEVAKKAGTTRPAVYRRYPTVEALAVAAIGTLAAIGAPTLTGDPIVDLTAELTSFRDGITSIDGLALVALALTPGADPAITASYRETVVGPRRARIERILRNAHRSGVITAGASERRALAAMCTGSWYGFAVAGTEPPKNWPATTAHLVFAATAPGR